MVDLFGGHAVGQRDVAAPISPRGTRAGAMPPGPRTGTMYVSRSELVRARGEPQGRYGRFRLSRM